MKFVVSQSTPVCASLAFDDAGNKFRDANSTVYFSGTLGVGATLELQVSPDPSIDDPVNGVIDGNSRWFTAGSIQFTSLDQTSWSTIQGRYRKARAKIVSPQVGDSCTVEIV